MNTSHSKILRMLLLGCLSAIAFAAQAQGLGDLYQTAQEYDASYQGARQQALATIARGEQAQAGILPSVNLGASVSQTSQSSSLSSYDGRDYNTQSGALTATQPIYRPANWATYAQGQKQIASAQALLRAAEQDLIVRVSQAYFDALAAADSLAFAHSQKRSVAEQLSAARRNFDVGTATVVDIRDAQSRFDLVVAQELAADNELRIKSLALDQLVGQHAVPQPLRTPLVLPATVPADVEVWVQQAQGNNPLLQQLQLAVDTAVLETRKAQAGHLPTLDLVGSYSASNNNGTMQTGSSYTLNQASIGLSLNLPLYAGGAIKNRLRETLALEDKARSDLEAAVRSTVQATRSAFLGVQSGQLQVQAYEAAQSSSESALEANQLGYQVGVKVNMDVLNAQSQLYSTKAALAKARYDVLMGGLRLRQVSGTLQIGDLERISSLLKD